MRLSIDMRMARQDPAMQLPAAKHPVTAHAGQGGVPGYPAITVWASCNTPSAYDPH